MELNRQSGSIYTLSIENKENIINPWGIEFADSSSFYSIEDGFGFRYEELVERESYVKNTFFSFRKISLKHFKGEISIQEDELESSITRTIEMRAVKEGHLMDFVLRYRFKKESIRSFKINDKEIFHNDSNIYHQHPVSQVTGLLESGAKVCISVDGIECPPSMTPVMYVRDQKSEWIVHCRFIPKKDYVLNTNVIKMCTAWAGSRKIPQKISNLLLCNHSIKKYLWYRAELRPYTNPLLRILFNPSAYSMAHIAKDDVLMIKSTIKFEDEVLNDCL
ncbi:hypothetical protein Q9Y03_000313 [Vibrio harveyi]|nr:hypothetical protein [Vibrio harveyi]